MKTTIKRTTTNTVTLSYDKDGEMTTRVFCVRDGGGYVREHTNGGLKQICKALKPLGITLYCGSPDKLLGLIRAEYRTARRAQYGR